MTSLYAAATPRPEVLEGTLTEAIFAASLDEVVAGSAPAAYGDSKAFFESTYPSAGLRQLLNEALGRISGSKPDAAPVIRLEENLGGGKTHNLIALYHAALGHVDPLAAGEFMDSNLLPRDATEQVAVFVGTGTGATSFPESGGVKPKTLWGHLALQLGGSAAYENVREDDEALTAPGSQAFRAILGGRPSLILLDELARYIQVADGVPVGGSTLAKQTTAFLMSLMEAVSGEPRTALVMTITQATDAYGGATQSILDALSEARALMARKEHTMRPSSEADLPRILARRLFADVDRSNAANVAQRYAKASEAAARRGIDLPEELVSGAWIGEIEQSYPFHPALIRVLDKRLSTIPNFQRTRGALRLLARGIRSLWQNHPEGVELIHLHHLDLSDKDLVEELTSRLDRDRLEPVVRADIASQAGGEPSNAEKVDARMSQPYGRRLATTTYLYSLTAEVPGTPVPELLGATLQPEDDAAVLEKALDTLEQSCWYLHADVRGLRFSTEASLVKLIQDEAQRLPLGKVKDRAQAILEGLFRDSALKVRRTWVGDTAGDQDDQAYLVLMHWDELQAKDPTAAVPDRIRELWEKTPSGGNRTYRNRLVILAPYESTHEAMLTTIRTHMALEALWKNGELRAGLSRENQEDLRQRTSISELESKVAVCNHMSSLFVPQQQGLVGYQLDIATQASLKPNQTDAVLEWLAAHEKTLAAGDKPLDPAYIRSKLGTFLDTPQPTIEIVRAFARRTDLKLVLDRERIRGLILDGIRNGVWEYHDPALGDNGWATKDRPDAPVRVAEDTLLYPPASAPAPEPVACPLCGEVHGPEGCKDTESSTQTPNPTFEAQGNSAVALAEARQEALDGGHPLVKELRITVSHNGAGGAQELARLHALVPDGQAGVDLSYDLDLQVEMDDPSHRLEIHYVGPPAGYQSMKSAIQQILGARPSVFSSGVSIQFSPPVELAGQDVQNILDRAKSTGPGSCQVVLKTETNG